MDEKQRQKMLLEIDYNKLLSYLAGILVFLFLLFQTATERSSIPRYLSSIVSLGSLIGTYVFLWASYRNYEEIIKFENNLGLSEIMKPSGAFSRRKKNDTSDDTPEREISPWLNVATFGLGFLCLVLFLFNIGILDCLRQVGASLKWACMWNY